MDAFNLSLYCIFSSELCESVNDDLVRCSFTIGEKLPIPTLDLKTQAQSDVMLPSSVFLMNCDQLAPMPTFQNLCALVKLYNSSAKHDKNWLLLVPLTGLEPAAPFGHSGCFAFQSCVVIVV